MSNEIKLSVNNLKVSFRTDAGKVQAVRNISFDLYKGETLAIVGESGSGKSVTSKAIMGISAVNSIHEGGEILYDGQDLMRIPEEEMHKLRGDKIAMIFQDPLSSLNPIMRIGKQITEAMLLKNKANRKEGRRAFNETLGRLSDMMESAIAADPSCGLDNSQVAKYIKTFDEFNIRANQLENSYNEARVAAEEIVTEINDYLFLYEKKQKVDGRATLNLVMGKMKAVQNKYFISGYEDEIKRMAVALSAQKKSQDNLPETLEDVRRVLNELISRTRYDFFRIGYHEYRRPDVDLSHMSAEEANEVAYRFLTDDFMTSFINYEKYAVKHSREISLKNKELAVRDLQKAIDYFKAGNFTQNEALALCKKLDKSVRAAIDTLEVIKDSIAYTFGGALTREVEKYFFYLQNNPKEEARFARQTAKREALLKKGVTGKRVSWQIIPKSVVDPEDQINIIVSVITRVMNKYSSDLENAYNFDIDKRCLEIIDYLKEKASQVVSKLTPSIAKERAIKLMEEVGIPEARMRFKQYPFEFSGGMRQRIVIAIALSANPDILICDEPTTALDVTIQAQILELINRLKKERNLSIIFITHDLGVVANMADRIAVMYAGNIVEYGTANEVFYEPKHPYTWALLSSMPDLDTNEKLDAIPGTPPNMIYPPVGDAFAERNKYAMEIDYEMQPPMFEVSPTHYAATWLLHPNAPKVEMPKIITERIKRMKERGGNYGE